ncbi:hypothetical protein MMC18_009622 [Xylographa bjoerkii]|nr:hypothetical protein [Xylographa bjoerkii]
MSFELPYNRLLHYGGMPHLTDPINHFQTFDPSTGKPIGDIQAASPADVDAAIQAAEKAFPSWSTTPAIQRSRVLHRAATLLRAANDEIARAETHDTGKPFSETSTVDVATGADVLEYYANLVGGGGLNGETVQLRGGVWCYTTKEPLGVTASLTIWHTEEELRFVVLTELCGSLRLAWLQEIPSEFTSLHGETLAQVYTDAGLPPGVFNVVNGDGGIGAYLTSHPSIAKVSFTGQVSTGKKVATSAASEMKYVTMELGGKSALIILEDAMLETAVDGAMMANFFSSGQVCTNGTRVFVPEQLKNVFEERLLEKMSLIRIGDLMDPKTNMGPLVSKIHYDKVVGYIKHGISVDKAELLYGGPDPPVGVPLGCENGYWVQPTIFHNCTDDMKIVRDEIFGPVMCILPYDTVEHAIRRANDTPLGLAAGVFTQDLNQAHTIISKLQAGITWVNTWGESPAEMSVGGWKQSGLGVENGRKGIEAWVRTKSTLVDMTGSVATAFTELEGSKSVAGDRGRPMNWRKSSRQDKGRAVRSDKVCMAVQAAASDL